MDEAGSATPDVVEAVERHGGQVASAREERPSFDEVFARLVEGDRARRQDGGNATRPNEPVDAGAEPVR